VLKFGRSGLDSLAVRPKDFKSWYSQYWRRQRVAGRGCGPSGFS